MKSQKISKALLMTTLITGMCIGGVQGVSAAEKDLEFTLDPWVVTAQRTETRDLDTPAATTIITAADIEKSGYTTTMEALRNVPGFTDTSYFGNGDDQGSSLSRLTLRGFDRATLVLLNGAPINVMNYASVSGIPVEAIDRIEVVKGANSVLYGAEAMGGVINIITKSGSGKLKTTLRGTTGNYLQKWGASIEGEGVVASISKEYLDEFAPAQKPNGTGSSRKYKVNKKYQKENAYVGLDLSPNLKLNWLYSNMNPSYVTNKVSDGSQTGSAFYYEDTKHALSLVYEDPNNGTNTTLAYNQKKVEGLTISSTATSKSATSNYTASNLYFDTNKKWDINDKDTLIIGLTAKHEKYDQTYKDNVDNDRNSYGIYASYDKKFNDKFSMALGLRGQYYADTEFDQSYEEILPQVQALYKLNSTTSWYANVGKAFELPAINAHTSAGGVGAEILSQYPVKPQMGWNYETGIKRITDTTATKLAVYHMDYENKFAWKHYDWLGEDTSKKIQVNLGKFENTGVELEYKKVLGDKWSYNLGATYQTPESYDEETKKWKQETARVQFTAGVDYKINKFSANVNCLYLGDREDCYYKIDGGSTSSGKYPDHKIRDRVKVNAALAYRPTKEQSINFNMYNLLDRDDSVSNYDYYDLPFNWTVTYTHTF